MQAQANCYYNHLFTSLIAYPGNAQRDTFSREDSQTHLHAGISATDTASAGFYIWILKMNDNRRIKHSLTKSLCARHRVDTQ